MKIGHLAVIADVNSMPSSAESSTEKKREGSRNGSSTNSNRIAALQSSKGKGKNVVNKTEGNRYEEKVAQILYDHGYWVTLLTASRTGQPADIIAIKGREFALIDAKLCAKDRFELRRVEPNQIRAMTMLEKRSGNAVAAFVLGMSTGNYIVSWERIAELMNQDVKSIKLADCEELITLEEWAG